MRTSLHLPSKLLPAHRSYHGETIVQTSFFEPICGIKNKLTERSSNVGALWSENARLCCTEYHKLRDHITFCPRIKVDDVYTDPSSSWPGGKTLHAKAYPSQLKLLLYKAALNWARRLQNIFSFRRGHEFWDWQVFVSNETTLRSMGNIEGVKDFFNFHCFLQSRKELTRWNVFKPKGEFFSNTRLTT